MDSLIQPHILVLDPDASVRVLLEAVVRRSGLRVTACGSERDAAEHCLRHGRYAVIILSTDMPNFDALLREICAAPAAERSQIIIAATDETWRTVPEAAVLLTKPFHMRELYAAIAKCCPVCGDDRPRLRPGNSPDAAASMRHQAMSDGMR